MHVQHMAQGAAPNSPGLPLPPCPARRSKLQEQEGKLRTAIQDKNNFQLVGFWGGSVGGVVGNSCLCAVSGQLKTTLATADIADPSPPCPTHLT